MIKHSRLALFSIYLTFFIDSLSWSIIFPIFAPYFLDVQNPLLPPETSLAARTTLLGLFLMAFSLGQFLASPLIGEYADKQGRKKALIVSIFFTFIGMVTTAISIKTYSLTFLFLGRLITGIFAGNASICLACISDLSETEQTKAKRFGFLSLLTGFSFVIGAFIGGKLSDPTIYPELSPDVPFWLTSCLTLINLLFITINFQETSPPNISLSFNLFESFYHIKEVLKTKKIKTIYTIYFLFMFAWTIIFQFTPVLVVHKYSFTSSQIGNLALFMGGLWALGSGLLNHIFVSHYKSKHILDVSLLVFTIFCAAIVFVSNLSLTLTCLGLITLVGALAWPHCTTVISETAAQNVQGKALGLTQSIQSLAMALAPLIGGISYQLAQDSAFLLAAVSSLIASLIYILKRR